MSWRGATEYSSPDGSIVDFWWSEKLRKYIFKQFIIITEKKVLPLHEGLRESAGNITCSSDSSQNYSMRIYRGQNSKKMIFFIETNFLYRDDSQPSENWIPKKIPE